MASNFPLSLEWRLQTAVCLTKYFLLPGLQRLTFLGRENLTENPINYLVSKNHALSFRVNFFTWHTVLCFPSNHTAISMAYFHKPKNKFKLIVSSKFLQYNKKGVT